MISAVTLCWPRAWLFAGEPLSSSALPSLPLQPGLMQHLVLQSQRAPHCGHAACSCGISLSLSRSTACVGRGWGSSRRLGIRFSVGKKIDSSAVSKSPGFVIRTGHFSPIALVCMLLGPPDAPGSVHMPGAHTGPQQPPAGRSRLTQCPPPWAA
jgi:hypothetical protein